MGITKSSLRWRYTIAHLMIFIAVANVVAITRRYYKLFTKNLVLYKYLSLIDLHSIVVFGGRLEEFCKISTSVAVLCMQTRDH